MADEKKRSGCLRYGCIGCAGLVLVAMGLAAACGIVAWRQTRVETSPEVYRPDTPRPVPLPGESPGASATPVRVVLDVGSVSFEVAPAPPGEPLSVSGVFDKQQFRLTEVWGGDVETGRTYELRFSRRGFFPRLVHSGPESELRLLLPREVPLTIVGHVGVGESTLELGGLRVVDVDIDFGIGDHTLQFSNPLVLPMGALTLHGGIGEMTLSGLGHASPEQVDIGHGLGELDIDLSGAWQRDAQVEVDCGIGECRIHVPRSVHLDLGTVQVRVGEHSIPEAEPVGEGQPTVHLSASATMGELKIDR